MTYDFSPLLADFVVVLLWPASLSGEAAERESSLSREALEQSFWTRLLFVVLIFLVHEGPQHSHLLLFSCSSALLVLKLLVSILTSRDPPELVFCSDLSARSISISCPSPE